MPRKIGDLSGLRPKGVVVQWESVLTCAIRASKIRARERRAILMRHVLCWRNIFLAALAPLLWSCSLGVGEALAGKGEETVVHGKVTGINKDHSLVIQEGGKTHVFYLYGIVFPTEVKGLSKGSRVFLEEATFGKQVRVKPISAGRSKRKYGLVFLDDLNLNEEMVRRGMAWVVPRGCTLPECDSLMKAQEEARASSKGVWAGKGVSPPWERGTRKR